MAILAAMLLSSGIAWSAQPTQMPPRRPANLPASPQVVPPAAEPVETSRPAAIEAPDAESGPQPASACITTLIGAYGGDVRAAKPEPGQDAACAVTEPMMVEALTIGRDGERRRVAFLPPVTLSCAMAISVAQWLETSVQPLAKGYFERDLTALRVGGGHECRRRNRSTSGPLSEHATGRALDVFAFVVGDGKSNGTVVVERQDGDRQKRFFGAVRQSACGAFMTSLGPGADAAHANHLHIDIQPRRSASSRFCQ